MTHTETRFFQRQLAPEIRGSSRPFFSAAVRRGTNCSLTDLDIECGEDTSPLWSATSATKDVDPASVLAPDRYWLGRQYLAVGRPYAARRWLQAALEDRQLSDGERADTVAQLIRAQGEIGDLTAARELFERWPREMPRPAMLLYQAGIVYQLLGQPQQALGCFRAVMCRPSPRDTIHGDDVPLNTFRAPHQLALCYLQLEQFTRAEETWTQLLSQHQRFAAAHAGVGELFLRQERFPAARKWAKMLVEIPNLRITGLLLWRRVASATHCSDEACRVLERGLRQYPEQPELMCELIDLQVASGELAEAQLTLTQLIQLFPHQTVYYRRAAARWHAQEIPSLAALAWQACVDWEPEHAVEHVAGMRPPTDSSAPRQAFADLEVNYRWEQLLIRD